MQSIHHRGFHDKNIKTSSSKHAFEVGLAASMINFMIQGCLGGMKKNERRSSKRRFHHHQHEKKDHHHHHHHASKNTGVVTLEEWITKSPIFNRGDQSQDCKQTSKMMHRIHDEVRLSESKKGFKVEKSSVKFDEEKKGSISGMVEDYSFYGSQSVRLKKVSFQEPEVADVFIILNSPEEHI